MSKTAAASLLIDSPQRFVPIAMVLGVLVAVPATGCILVDGESVMRGSFLTFDELPPASPPEERLTAYAEMFEALAMTTKDGGRNLPSLADFVDVAVDFSSLVDPEDALAATQVLLAPANGGQPIALTTDLYERLGVALLSAAREARLSQELDRADDHLRGARHAFALADQHAQSADPVHPAGGSELGLLHRAMVGLEEMAISDSQDAWSETAALLESQLELEPTGPLADWAWRMLRHPATYLADEEVRLDCNHSVGGDLRKPVKIFAPRSRYTTLAKRARIQGVVIVQVVIDRHGNVAGLKLLKGLPMGLGDEALRMMATWLFAPATLHGEPVSVYYNLTMRFGL